MKAACRESRHGRHGYHGWLPRVHTYVPTTNWAGQSQLIPTAGLQLRCLFSGHTPLCTTYRYNLVTVVYIGRSTVLLYIRSTGTYQVMALTVGPGTADRRSRQLNLECSPRHVLARLPLRFGSSSRLMQATSHASRSHRLMGVTSDLCFLQYRRLQAVNHKPSPFNTSSFRIRVHFQLSLHPPPLSHPGYRLESEHVSAIERLQAAIPALASIALSGGLFAAC